ncbi:N-formylglutamate amidohydrolase [Heliomarina baculiformis]|uniref:N-formylglutamate amidohydrolase n=1 Tax=Heliomarina baculiformis TaxID=2872036 RepID=UPI001EE20EE2|nr:N-formylglutamate amidohydrolase [Heliomarina baculiformis]
MTYFPFSIQGETRPGWWLVTSDRTRNTVPSGVKPKPTWPAAGRHQRHIAYDIGARGLSLHVARLLNAPVIASSYSRLVTDPNRGEDAPTLLMKVYDGTIIRANRHADGTEQERRLDAHDRPYNQALAQFVARPGHGDPVCPQPAACQSAISAICRVIASTGMPRCQRYPAW